MNKNVYFTNTSRFPFLGLLCPCQCFDQMDTVYNNDKYIIIFSFLRGSSLEFYSLVTTWILKGINEREGLWPRRMHSGSWCTAAAAAVVHQGAGCADPCTPRSTFLQVGIHPVAAACARPCALNALQSAVLLFLPHPSLLLLLFLLLLLQWLQSCISMPPEHNSAFLTHKLHSGGKWQNWMRRNLEGNNFWSTSSRKNAHPTGFWWRPLSLRQSLF